MLFQWWWACDAILLRSSYFFLRQQWITNFFAVNNKTFGRFLFVEVFAHWHYLVSIWKIKSTEIQRQREMLMEGLWKCWCIGKNELFENRRSKTFLILRFKLSRRTLKIKILNGILTSSTMPMCMETKRSLLIQTYCKFVHNHFVMARRRT